MNDSPYEQIKNQKRGVPTPSGIDEILDKLSKYEGLFFWSSSICIVFGFYGLSKGNQSGMIVLLSGIGLALLMVIYRQIVLGFVLMVKMIDYRLNMRKRGRDAIVRAIKEMVKKRL